MYQYQYHYFIKQKHMKKTCHQKHISNLFKKKEIKTSQDSVFAWQPSPKFQPSDGLFFPGGIFSAETTEGAGLSPSRMDFKCMNLVEWKFHLNFLPQRKNSGILKF